MILSEGADEGMIISAINKAVSRRNRTRINSFRYFLPMIRETLREESDGLRHGNGGSPPIDDGFIHSGCIDDEVLAGCMSEEDLMTALDRELGHDPGWDSAPVDYSE